MHNVGVTVLQTEQRTASKKPFKETFRFSLYSLLTCLSPELSTRVQYRIQNGRPLHLHPPVSFSEKLSWLKLKSYAHDPLVRRCTDKLAVRSYVKECGCDDLLNELLGVYSSTEDIPWDKLPERCVLKWNFGCGFNLFVNKASDFDPVAASAQLNAWRRVKYWNYHAELQYKGIEPRILCERFLDTPHGEALIDYKFYSFSDKVRAVLVIERKEGTPARAVFMTPDWRYLSDIPRRYHESFLPKRPLSLERMIAAAERLSAPFPFVRVDFYELDGKPIFGEMTFTPAASINPSECLIDGKTMGELLSLEV